MSTTVHVVGSIVTPDAAGVGGFVTFELSQPGRSEGVGGTGRVVKKRRFAIVAGVVDFYLIPNDVIDPAGTYYLVTYEMNGQVPWAESVVVTSSPSTQEIGDLDVIGESIPTIEGRFVPPLFPAGIAAGSQYDGWIWRVPGVPGVSPGAIRTCLINGAGDTWDFIDVITGGP